MMEKAFDTMKEIFDNMDAGMRKTFDDMVSALTPRAGRSRGRRADASAHPAAFSPPPEKLDEFYRPRPIKIPEDDRARWEEFDRAACCIVIDWIRLGDTRPCTPDIYDPIRHLTSRIRREMEQVYQAARKG